MQISAFDSGESKLATIIKKSVVHMTELHRQLGQVIRQVALGDEHNIVEKGGLPVAALLPMAEYERLVRDWKLKEFERHSRALGEEAERRGITEEQLMADLEETRNKEGGLSGDLR